MQGVKGRRGGCKLCSLTMLRGGGRSRLLTSSHGHAWLPSYVIEVTVCEFGSASCVSQSVSQSAHAIYHMAVSWPAPLARDLCKIRLFFPMSDVGRQGCVRLIALWRAVSW